MPSRREARDIDALLANWPFRPGEVNARLMKASGDREVIQMRVDMGVLQMETEHRPDGERPGGAETYFDYLVGEVIREGDDFELSDEQCSEADREFVQFYHRRVCWLSLREYARAAKDADHSLAFMDFVRQHSPDEEWTLSHEQYRPFVLFHRVQAGALAALEDDGPEKAISEINAGLDRFRDLFEEYDAADQFAEDELVQRLEEMRENVRSRYDVGLTLDEQLAEAVRVENYERAAELRDLLRTRPRAATLPGGTAAGLGEPSNAAARPEGEGGPRRRRRRKDDDAASAD